MIRKVFLAKVLMKAGISQAQADEFLSKPDEDFPDAEANAALGKVMTEDEAVGSDTVFGKIKDKAKGEVLTPFTTLLGKYEKKLTAAQKVEYAKVGDDPSKKYEFLLDKFEALGTNTGDKNYDDLKRQFDDLNTKLGTDYVPKADHEAVNTKLTQREKQLVDTQLVGHAARNKKLRDVGSDRHFERNFLADANHLLEEGIPTGPNQKVKGTYNAETGKVMRVDSPDQPVLVDGKAVTLDVLADLTISNDTYGWGKKSDAAPQNEVRIPTTPPSGGGLTSKQRAEIEQQ